MKDLLSRVMPNVLVAIIAGAALTGLFGYWLIERLPGEIGTEILALLVGVGIGGLFAIAGTLAAPSPGPVVPQSSHDKLIDTVLGCKSKKD